MIRPLAFASVLALAALACRRQPPPPDRTEPWPAPGLPHASESGSATPKSRAVFVLERSEVSFALPARRATPRGRITRATGELEVDLVEPERTRGHIELDLASIELFGSDGLPDATYAERARAWLELGAELPAAPVESGRFARFTLRSLARAGARTSGSGDAARPTAWTVEGDLAVHGVRAPEATEITVSGLPLPSAWEEPRELVIRSRRPLEVALETHDIRPRDSRGVLLTREAGLVGESVGKQARIDFELTFVPRK